MIDSCAIIVTQANELVSQVHGRMPVILDPANYELWLDPATKEPRLLDPLLRSYPVERMMACAISRRLNNPKNDDSSLLATL